MLVIEFLAGPGAGKTTTAAALYTKLKRKSKVNVDFAREGAQHLIHTGCAHKLANQLNIVAHEYDRMLNMKEQGCKVLITDTSMLMTKIYGKGTTYYDPLLEVINKLREEFVIKSVFVNRVKPFIQYGRMQDEEQSKEIDEIIKETCGPFDLTVNGDDTGIKELFKSAKLWINDYMGEF